MEETKSYIDFLQEQIWAYAPKIVLAILILIIGFWVIRRIINLIEKALDRSGVGPEIKPFLGSLISVGLKVLLIFSVAGILGIETTSFVAVLAALGFAVGMALQGSLSNFAAGVMILIFRPYKVHDLVTIEGESGHVKAIQIFNTIIITLDNRTIIIPNSTAIGGIITNLSAQQTLRLDLKVTMPYAEDFPKVQTIILEAIKSTPKVLETPEPFVGIETFDSHSIVLTVRPYANTEDYWDVYFEANKNIKQALSNHNIQVAYSEGVELGPIGK
jgi:small conductance mechanosensitive channel